MHTVIGLFDEMPYAQLARDRLRQQLPSGRIHLGAGHVSPSGEIITEGHGGRQKYENRSVLAALGSFWANLVESHAHSHALDLAMQRGCVVVAVQVDHDAQAADVAQVMAQSHAFEVQHGEAPRVGSAIREPQPWHAADEHPAQGSTGGGAPIGTHSLTGGGANVGMPERSRSQPQVEHGSASSTPPERSHVAELLGQRPEAGRER